MLNDLPNGVVECMSVNAFKIGIVFMTREKWSWVVRNREWQREEGRLMKMNISKK